MPPLKNSSSKRPFGVSVIVLLILAYAVFMAVVFYLSSSSQYSGIAAQLVHTLSHNQTSAIIVVEIFVLLVIALGLWRLQRWSWVLLMIWVGVQIFFDLWDYFYNHELHTTSMLICVMIVFYINQREVKKAFSGKTLAGVKWTI